MFKEEGLNVTIRIPLSLKTLSIITRWFPNETDWKEIMNVMKFNQTSGIIRASR